MDINIAIDSYRYRYRYRYSYRYRYRLPQRATPNRCVFIHIVCDTYLCDHCVGTPCCGINDVVIVAVKIIARGVSVAPSGDPEIHKIEPGFFYVVVHHISIANLPILG